MPWNLGSWSTTFADRTDVHLGFVQNIAGAEFAHAVTFSADLLGPKDYQQVVLRLICHFLVNQVRPEGLRSLYESLMDHIDFYRLPSNAAEPFGVLESAPVKADVATVYERPQFHITEE